MKTAHITAFAIALAGLAAAANISPAHAGDAEDALDECLDNSPPAFFGFGAVIQLGCYAGYAIETAGDDEEEEEEENARPFPGIGRQAAVPLTAVVPQRQTASPLNMNQPYRPMLSGPKSVGAASLQAPAVKQRPMAKKVPQAGRAQPSAAVEASTASPRRALPRIIRSTR